MRFIARNEADLKNVAERLLNAVKTKKIVALYGEMGAGKTTFIKQICRSLNVIDTISSPTFALVYEYITASGTPVYHFDFYRIEKLEEIYDYGYEQYFYSGNICLLEWSEKVEPLLPENTLKIRISVDSDNSRIFDVFQ